MMIKQIDVFDRILVLNSLTQHRMEIIEVIVSSVEVSIVDSNGEQISCQLNPIINRNFQISSDKFKVTLTRILGFFVIFVQY